MAIEIRHSGQTVAVASNTGQVTARSPSYSVGVTSGIIQGGTPYEGAYEVTPSESTQVLSTASRMLASDLTINPIPSNYGLITYNGSTILVS